MDRIRSRFGVDLPSEQWQARNPDWQSVPPDSPRWRPDQEDANGDLRPELVPPNGDAGLITEGAVADSFRQSGKDKLRYDHSAGKWFLWDGMRWRREETELAFSWAHKQARAMAAESGETNAEIHAGKASFAAGVERIAQADRAFAVTHEIWDRDPWLLGTPGGVVDLRTGDLRPAAQDDFITKLAGCAPAEPGTSHPLWSRFLAETTGQDAELQRFLQQIAGYSLTGDTREHALFFVYGPGGNGKSVFLNVLTALGGDYATIADPDSFTATGAGRHLTVLARLQGARLVTAQETEEGVPWAEARIKSLTGGDPITANFMRKDHFTFLPQFKLVIVGNHKPVLRNIDNAAKRRFNIIPFNHTPAAPDKDLERKLRAELPAILRWAIDGCLDWQRYGLVRPAVVMDATAGYFTEQDLFQQWCDECCETGGRNLFDTQAVLFASWSRYAQANGERPGTAKWFSQALHRLGAELVRDTPGHRNKRGFFRIRVKPVDVSDQWQNREDEL
jgi:putative DNA primase/helicase